jgi:hypothetical protein
MSGMRLCCRNRWMSYDRVRSRMRCRMMKSAKTNSLFIPADFRDEREEIVDEDSESEKL